MIRYGYLFIILSFCLASCGTSRKSVKRTYKSSSSRTASSNKRPATKVVTSAKESSSITAEARGLIRRPYRYGGESPSGFDCSGLVQYVYSKHGVQLPRRSSDQARYGKSVSIRDARPGDLIFFKSGGRVNHVGIISDTGGKFPSMVHSSSSKGVIEVDIDDSSYWRSRLAYIRRP